MKNDSKDLSAFLHEVRDQKVKISKNQGSEFFLLPKLRLGGERCLKLFISVNDDLKTTKFTKIC